MIYFLQLQRLGLADVYPVVGTKGYLLVVDVHSHAELQDLLRGNPMWPVEDYRVLAVTESRGPAGSAQPAFAVLARPAPPVPPRANVAATTELLEELTVGRGGRLLELIEDRGYGFLALVTGLTHDDLMTRLFSIPLGSWGEYEILLLGSMEAEHRAVVSAGMLPEGALPSRAQPRPSALDRPAVEPGRLRELSPVELAGLLAGNDELRLVDVRTPAETSEGTVPAATNLPLDDLPVALEAWVARPPPALVFICAEGRRSLVAARAARRAGLDASSLRGGIKAWREAGHALVTGG